MCGHQITNPLDSRTFGPSRLLSLALVGCVGVGSLGLGGCVRYYAGAGYASTWTRPTTQGYATATPATPPVVVLQTGWDANVSAPTTLATLETNSTATASSSAAMSAPSIAGGGSCTGICASEGASLSASAGGSIEVVPSLGGLCGPGAPIEGGVARLGDLDALASLALDASAPLYADANVRVRASLAHDALPARGGESSVVVSVEGLAPPAIVPPLRVHLVIDASTSMEGAWDDVKRAALAVVRRLRPEDELQIVVYGTDAREALAPIAIGDGSRARGVISTLRFGGRTNIESGLRLAYGACRDAGRSLVIVVSDGVPQGGLSTADELGALAAQANLDDGAVTLAIGLGTEFHTGILAALGSEGGGELRIAPRSSELAALLQRELAARGAIVASGIHGSVIAAPGVTIEGSGSLGLGALTAGQTQTFVVPITTTHAGSIAHVRLSFVDASGQSHELEASLSLAQGATAVARGSMGAVLDLSLATALREAGRLIENGEGTGAAAVLRAHVAEAEASLAVRPDPALARRDAAVLRIAAALPSLVTEASWGARRQAGASFVERAFVISGR